jgi:predicted DNA-binding transcriptional regulator AlpA
MNNIIITTPEQLRHLLKQELLCLAAAFQPTTATTEDSWFDLNELIEYLPGRPSKATIYGYVSKREIPSHKNGKRLAFLKSEIDAWLKGKRRKTVEEITAEAELYIIRKAKGGVR